MNKENVIGFNTILECYNSKEKQQLNLLKRVTERWCEEKGNRKGGSAWGL